MKRRRSPEGIVGACAPIGPEAEWPTHWQKAARRVRQVKRALTSETPQETNNNQGATQ